MTDRAGGAWRHVEQLSVAIGPRPVGSAANLAAAGYIARALAEAGLRAEQQMFAAPRWEARETELRLAGQALPARANVFSPPCRVSGPAVPAGTLAELRAADLAGRLALLHGGLTAGTGLGSRRAVYCSEHDREVLALLEAKRPLAVITVHSRRRSLEPLMRDWDLPVASATVPAEAGLRLMAAGSAAVTLRIDSRCEPGQYANVAARLPGERPERVLVCAHLDSVTGSPGAVDNAAGVAVLLALARGLAGRRLPLTVELVAFNGEEDGGLGDVAYLQRDEAGAGRLLAVVNLDGVGQALGANSVAVLNGSPALQAAVAEVVAAFPGAYLTEPWYESDHGAFAITGLPCLALTSNGVKEIMHTPDDCLEWLSPAKLGEALALVEALLERLPGQLV